MRLFLVILAALVVAGGTGFYMMQSLQMPAPQPEIRAEAPQLRKVYVPSENVAAGTILETGRLDRVAMPEAAITDQMVVADADGDTLLAGSVARQMLPQGVPIARSAIVQPGDRGFLAAVLPRGKRAITIPISEVTGLNGLVQPGDRVDIILTYGIEGTEKGADAIRASETVLQNIRVLALDQRVGVVPSSPDEGAGFDPDPIAQTATLEVLPREAEVIALADDMGALSLSLNSVRDEDLSDPPTSPVEHVSSARKSDFNVATRATQPRRLTRESDVTSTTKIQVVRGMKQTAAPAPAPSPANEATADAAQ